MKTVEELLKSKGREVMSESTLKYLAKRGELISPLVADSYKAARAQLGTGATDDALARRASLILLKQLGHVPDTAPKVAPAEPVAQPENPGETTQPAK